MLSESFPFQKEHQQKQRKRQERDGTAGLASLSTSKALEGQQKEQQQKSCPSFSKNDNSSCISRRLIAEESPLYSSKVSRSNSDADTTRTSLTDANAAHSVSRTTSTAESGSSSSSTMKFVSDNLQSKMTPALKAAPHQTIPVSESPINSSPAGAAPVPSSSHSTSTVPVQTPKKKRKRPNPFRVRVGCVAALRYRPGGSRIVAVPSKQLGQMGDGNASTPPTSAGRKRGRTTTRPTHVEVWTDPLAGRDDGLALIGRRIRCFFPRSVLTMGRRSGGDDTEQKKNGKKPSRIVEGEVVSVLENRTRKGWRRDGNRGGTVVELLVDKNVLSSVPYLRRTDEEDAGPLSNLERKRRMYEEIIRGKNKATVRVMLADVADVTGATPSILVATDGRGDKLSLDDIVAVWVIRKRIPVPSLSVGDENRSVKGDKRALPQSKEENPAKRQKLDKNGKTRGRASSISNAMTWYVGDKNDSPAQQERNWRWLAGRYKNLHSQLGPKLGITVDESTLFVGEVLRVAASASTLSKSSSSSSSLATVTLRKLWIPEHTAGGRTSQHGVFEVFDDADVTEERCTEKEAAETSSPSQNSLDYCLYQVPVEDLVVLSRRLERRAGRLSVRGEQNGAIHAWGSHFVVTHAYSEKRNQYIPLYEFHGHTRSLTKDSEDKEERESDCVLDQGSDETGRIKKDVSSGIEICHRCRRKGDALKMKQCTSEWCCEVISTLDERGQGSVSGKWWCGDCCRILRSAGIFSDDRSGNWTGPCCFGSCDCNVCEETRRGTAMDFLLRSLTSAAVVAKNYPWQRTATHDCRSRNGEGGWLHSHRCSTCFRPCVKTAVNCNSCSRVAHDACASWESVLASLCSHGVNGRESAAGTTGWGGFASIEARGGAAHGDMKPRNDALRGLSESLHCLQSGMENELTQNGQKEKNNQKEGRVSQASFLCRSCQFIRKKQRALCDARHVVNMPESRNQRGFSEQRDFENGKVEASLIFRFTKQVVSSLCPIDFDLPVDFLDPMPVPSTVVISSSNAPLKKVHNRDGRDKTPTKRRMKTSKKRSQKKQPTDTTTATDMQQLDNPSEEEEQGFKPTCCRTVPYDPHRKRSRPDKANVVEQNGMYNRVHLSHSRDIIVNRGRKNVRAQGTGCDGGEKKVSSRAARANQRRLMKDVASFGATNLGLDSLAGREQQLRFGKSLIHGWGVFADEAVSAGDVIVEYRGQLIGNAVAEKREKEYEKAKIGSDYMFRIDENTVCDATKQGNVARFINASCNPNCYTQIITVNGSKRIVIYAKKDILPGEELCYDYKFPIEYDEKKRIKCHCGAPDCRGFMNWDKRYVALPLPQE